MTLKKKFPLTSDQLELLIAFEKSEGLDDLAAAMAKDASVISRNLQRMAESLAVIEKVNRRWKITELGKFVVQTTLKYLEELNRTSPEKKIHKSSRFLSNEIALVVINAQRALLNPDLGTSSNSQVEEKINQLLKFFREKNRTIIHVKHVSKHPKSVFHKDNLESDFIPLLAPQGEERVVEKFKSSSFTETQLNEILESLAIESLILVGFTANDCIDATAKNSSELGFNTFVVGDATATFDIAAHDGKLYKAEKIHNLTLANLHAFGAEVILADHILKS
jgi:nicotinamidase-related amidase